MKTNDQKKNIEHFGCYFNETMSIDRFLVQFHFVCIIDFCYSFLFGKFGISLMDFGSAISFAYIEYLMNKYVRIFDITRAKKVNWKKSRNFFCSLHNAHFFLDFSNSVIFPSSSSSSSPL